ncbi:MAG: anthranilate synthase component I family protein [Promethearchaeota archaeon]
MDLNVNIKKIGRTDDIFGFYKYLVDKFESKNHALLESVSDSSREMLFSFIGIEPDFMIKICGEKLDFYEMKTKLGEKIKENAENIGFASKGKPDIPFDDDVPINIQAFDLLQGIFPISRSAMPELFPRKVFSGGLLGYIGYDVVAPHVGYKPSSEMQEIFPDLVMGFFTNVVAYSHVTKTIYHISNSVGNYNPDNVIPFLYDKFTKEKRSNKGKLDLLLKNGKEEDLESNFKSNTTAEEWEVMIEKAKEHIVNGDIIQAVISRKVMTENEVPPMLVYQALKVLNPSPYMFYLNFEDAHGGDIRIIGSSPEALITKNQSSLQTVPIAGTRRRGRDEEDEKRMEYELLHSEKELAEHVMLVDLARNDLARVSYPGSVETFELLKLKKFPHVMHLTSKVRSRSPLDPFSILKSMFPAGTVSGAPKKRAMEIIHELEKEDRGPYAGCVGYVSFIGDMDMAISIRTIFNKNKLYFAQAGAGIVADSDPKEEFLETRNKMNGILSAITLGEKLSKIKHEG